MSIGKQKSSTQSFAINGRFLTVQPTGVQRVAQELTLAIDSLLESTDAFDFELITPRKTVRQLELRNISVRSANGFSSGALWEQTSLPLATKRRILINLCNTGPLIMSDAVTMIHDAQVYTSPDSYPLAFRTFYRSLHPVLGHRHRAIVTVSNYSKNELVHYGVAQASNICVIHNGVDHIQRIREDTSVFAASSLSAGQYVIAPSSTQSHKNIGFLFEVFSSDKLRHHKLVLFGSADRESYVKLGMSVPDNVAFVGRVTDGQLKSLLAQALCFLLPSTTEGFGLPPMEAMLLGCPAIVAPTGALPEICGDGALYADCNDAERWRSLILQMSQDRDFTRSRSEIGRLHASEFTWDRAARQLLAILSIPVSDRNVAHHPMG